MIVLPPHPRFDFLRFHMCAPGNDWLASFMRSLLISNSNMACSMLFENKGQQYIRDLLASVVFVFCDFS